MYKISLIIKVKNDTEVLLNNLNSLTKQTIGFENLEIILIGNEKVNWKPINNFSKKYNNIYSYTFKKNKHINYRNLALKYATSEYLMFLDVNEIHFVDSCETLYTIIHENNTDIVSGNFIYENDKNYKTNSWNNIQLTNGFYEIKDISENPKILEFNPSLGTKIFNKNFLIKNNIKFKNNVLEDLIFVTESLQKAKGIIFFNKTILKTTSEEKEHLNEKKSLNRFITDLETYYHELDHKSEFSKFILKNVEDIFKYIISNEFSSEEILALCVKMNFLVKECILNKFSPIEDFKFLFKLISDKKYNHAVKLIILLKKKDSFDYNIIKNKDILLLFYGFDYDIGGLGKAVFNRANLLSDKGLNITLINTDPYTENYIGEKYYNIPFIENKFRKLNYINDSVKFVNILEYYKKKNTNIYKPKVKPKINLNKNIQINDKYIIQKIKDEFELKIFNYYCIDDFNNSELDIITKLFEEPMPKNINKFDVNNLFNKNIIKTEYYVYDTLYIKSINGENNQTDYEYLYTEDGFNYLKIEREERYKFKYKLYSSESTSEIIFEYYKEFCDYFIKEMCLNCNEKPILVNDCSGPIPSFNNIPHEMAYKIGNIHSNPYLEPTYCYGSPRREMSALKCVNQLDALVALTETEKNDFIKEFKTQNIYSIPNLIDLKDIEELNKKKFTVDATKISIFARISPEKNIDDLIKAFKIVVDKHPHAKLNIYGRAITYGEIQALKSVQEIITELDIEQNILFRGHVDNAYEEMRTSLATILVSHIEGLPMVIIESMANKTPVICYNINYGPKDVICNGKDGFIVEKYNIEELAEKINFVLDNPDIAIKMGDAAQETIFDKFDLDKIYKQWLNVFKEAYFNSIFREIHNTYIIENNFNIKKDNDSKNNSQKNAEQMILNEKKTTNNKQQNTIQEQKNKIEAQNKEIETKQTTNNKQQNTIQEQKNKIEAQNKEIETKQTTNNKQQNIIIKQEQIMKNQEHQESQLTLNNKQDEISNLKTTNEYYKLKTNPKKRLTLILPYLYIIYKRENITENIKFYRKITKNEWVDIGYYLNTNTDIKRNKWCKILTPETHYTCHGFNEKRLPHPNYKNNLTKKEIIKKASDNNV